MIWEDVNEVIRHAQVSGRLIKALYIDEASFEELKKEAAEFLTHKASDSKLRFTGIPIYIVKTHEKHISASTMGWNE